MWEDRRLLDRLRCCDPEALRRLYEKYKDELLTVAACMLGQIAPAEDCLQDVFVSLAAQASELRLRSGVREYLVTCIANRARDYLRRGRRQSSLEGLADPVSSAAGPLTSAIDGEESARWYELLRRLPEEQREVITLHLHGGMRFRQIAQLQETSINTVQSRYRYGLEKLRLLIEEGAHPCEKSR